MPLDLLLWVTDKAPWASTPAAASYPPLMQILGADVDWDLKLAALLLWATREEVPLSEGLKKEAEAVRSLWCVNLAAFDA
eukprot:gene7653-9117_t